MTFAIGQLGRLGRLGAVGGSASRAIALNFLTGQYTGATPVCSRASVGYINDISGNWSQVLANTLRRADGVGLLTEPAATLSLRTNDMTGAVAGVVGSGGALPNNWAVQDGRGMTTTVVSVGTLLGLPRIRIRINGSPSSSGNYRLGFESTTQVVANTGETWTISAFIALQAGTLTNIANVCFIHQERDAVGTSIRSSAGSAFTPTATCQRQGTAVKTMGASTARDEPEFSFDVTLAQAVDVTFDIVAPMLEQGFWASSPLQSTSAAVTRAADVVTLSGVPLFNPSAYSMFYQGIPNWLVTPAGAPMLLALSTGAVTTSEVICYLDRATGRPVMSMNTASVSQYDNTVSAVNHTGQPGTRVKFAHAVAPGNQIGAADATTLLRTGASIPTPNLVTIGGRGNGAQQAAGYTEIVKVWPTRRISNAAALALGSP